MKEAPSLPDSDDVGPRQRQLKNKQEKRKMHNKSKVFGLITLFIKANFLLAGITLWKMPMVDAVFVTVPLYQTVGTTIFAVLVYMELKASFAQRTTERLNIPSKSKKRKSQVEEAGLEYLA